MPQGFSPLRWSPLAAILAAATLLALILVNLLTLGGINSARPLIIHTRQLHDALGRMRAALADAESAQRGFLLTGDRLFLEAVQRANDSLFAGFAQVMRAAADDGGRPIPPDLLPRIFEPFRRGAKTGAKQADGLGLGLFIARQIVLAHGGKIGVRSAERDGTTFTVALPSEAGQRSGAATVAVASAQGAGGRLVPGRSAL